MQAQQYLEQYHLIRLEVEQCLDRLAVLRALAQDPTPELNQADRQLAQRMASPEDPRLRSLDEQRLCRALTALAEDRRQRAAAEYDAYAQQCEPKLTQYHNQMRQIEQQVDAVSDALCREVLRARYLEGRGCRLTPWRQVAMHLYGDDDPAALQYIRRLHQDALAALALSFAC